MVNFLPTWKVMLALAPWSLSKHITVDETVTFNKCSWDWSAKFALSTIVRIAKLSLLDIFAMLPVLFINRNVSCEPPIYAVLLHAIFVDPVVLQINVIDVPGFTTDTFCGMLSN